MDEAYSQRDHFTGLDGIRGLLAVFVMLMHFGMDRIISVATRGLIQRCEWELSVDFFFVLSGFVLARSFGRKLPTLSGYFRKRVFRLAPMYITALAIVIVAGIDHNRTELVLNVLIVQSLFNVASLNFPSWSIPYEMFFPLAGVVAARYWNRWSPTTLYVILAILVVVAMACDYALAIGSDFRLGRAIAGIALGMILYRAAGISLPRFRVSPLAVLALFAAILLVMVTAHTLPLVALGFHPLVVALILSGATVTSVFSTAPFQVLGRWSYSIYLLHIPVMKTAVLALGPHAVDHNPALKLALAAITIAVAGLAYRFIERPITDLAR